jgi:hypothetical protein
MLTSVFTKKWSRFSTLIFFNFVFLHSNVSQLHITHGSWYLNVINPSLPYIAPCSWFLECLNGNGEWCKNFTYTVYIVDLTCLFNLINL